MSALLTREDVKGVVEALTPAIKAFMAKFAKRQVLAIVVLDPSNPVEPIQLYATFIGDESEDMDRFYRLAVAKAELCHREHCDSEVACVEKPFRLLTGDPPYMGGVYVQGLVVACSGFEGYFDQMFARWIAAGCRAIATHRLLTEVSCQGLDAIP